MNWRQIKLFTSFILSHFPHQFTFAHSFPVCTFSTSVECRPHCWEFVFLAMWGFSTPSALSAVLLAVTVSVFIFLWWSPFCLCHLPWCFLLPHRGTCLPRAPELSPLWIVGPPVSSSWGWGPALAAVTVTNPCPKYPPWSSLLYVLTAYEAYEWMSLHAPTHTTLACWSRCVHERESNLA